MGLIHLSLLIVKTLGDSMNITVFDLETTGFNHNKDQILEIGAYKIENGVASKKFHSYVRPTIHIPPYITDINGITDELVMYADPIEDVLPRFFEFCGDDILLGHNITDFDFRFIQAWGMVCGVDFSLGGTRHGIDTLKIAHKYIKKPAEIKDHKLKTLVEYFEITVAEAKDAYHTAWFDAYVIWLVFQRLKIKYGDVVSIPERLKCGRG